MKILVTGAGGFLGKAIVDRLLAHGQTDLRCMLRDTSKARGLEAIAARYPQAKLEFVTANLRNLVEIAPAVAGCEMVIHAAAALKGSPAEMFMDSVVASRNLLESVVNELRPIRVVLVSSFGVMGVAELPRGAMVDENTPLEQHPERRDVYAHSKWRQEQLFWEYRAKYGFELVVLRPGVIYGPGGGHFSTRVGLNLFGRFLHLGGNNVLPLTYVDNCAEAIAVAALSGSDGEVYNVVDDDLVTSKQYLAAYKKHVRKVRSVPVPYFALMWGSKMVERYSERSKGQLPAIFTPYKTRAMWAGNQFSNAKLKSIGWRPLISTREGMEQAFAAFRTQPEKAK
ncbi:NAD-dependent epimerase/dehydratase family protein [Edaphobacter modestus]|uniref:Nucleoside-diphosphate-sugar epimerase n=1 Tax=Edaphobacter modestus TaxID=388466 RepID=A0A4Q7YUC9_9BACT|nr:NAD(P)-dependent oxidoreductase [Edaphobacter modestus]RZU40904.1 nucleoside-diphosphate-sugar epimerase [Edaphobacter modestus]